MKNKIHLGDCREILASFPENCIDAIVTDPPYELGFMGKKWDSSGVSYDVKTWAAALRVLKPGGHLLAFGGTRTYHRIACAIEDAGFEIRDQLQWLYGQGFPKSLDVSKAIDKAAGVKFKSKPASGVGFMNAEGKGGYNTTKNQLSRDGESTDCAKKWQGWGTALKPANEPICLARKYLSEKTVAANVLKWGTGALNIDACRIGKGLGGSREGESSKEKRYTGEGATNFAAKPGPRGGDARGRWPSNVLLDEEAARLLDEQSGNLKSGAMKGQYKGTTKDKSACFGEYGYSLKDIRPSEGGASRFFYCAKTSKRERGEGNTHPTVKPIALMSYLIDLITPARGIVLDPFSGSGSTLIAAAAGGRSYIGVELISDHREIAERRIKKEMDGRLL